MAFGGRFIADHGTNLIDETFKSMCVVDSGNLTTNTTMYGMPARIITYAGINPILAIADNVPFAIIEQGRVGTTFYWTVVFDVASSANFNYYIFDDVPATAPSGYGMVVRNAAGAIVFNSNFKYLRIQGAPPYAAGRTYAAICANGANRVQSVDMGGGTWETRTTTNFADIDANVVTFSSKITNVITEGSGGKTYAPFTTWLIVDVTNY